MASGGREAPSHHSGGAGALHAGAVPGVPDRRITLTRSAQRAASHRVNQHTIELTQPPAHSPASSYQPSLDTAWRRLAGLANTRIVVSAEELAAIEDGIERILAPYVTRDPAERPTDGRGVRLMRYVLPEGTEEQTGQTP